MSAKRTSYGDGLTLIVQPTGSGRWYARFTYAGERHNVSLGSLLDLPDEHAARDAMVAVWKAVGHAPRPQRPDPVPALAPTSAGRPRAPMPVLPPPADGTLGAYIEHEAALRRAKGEQSAKSWESTMRRYCAPLWSRPVAALTTKVLVDAILLPAHRQNTTADKPTSAVPRKLRIGLRQVLSEAVYDGTLAHNPAEGRALDDAWQRRVPAHRSTPHPAIAWQHAPQVAQALTTIGRAAQPCLTFTLLTAVRRDEARLARWSEFDMQAAVWTIPADRTKTGTVHRVPLSTQALRIVEGQRVRAEALDSPYVFPTKTGRPLARSVLHHEAKRVMSATVHGWRAAFRTRGVRRPRR